jgi:hypothetical protein
VLTICPFFCRGSGGRREDAGTDEDDEPAYEDPAPKKKLFKTPPTNPHKKARGKKGVIPKDAGDDDDDDKYGNTFPHFWYVLG